MKQGTGELVELYLEDGLTGGRLLCPQNLIPSPGQYVSTHNPASLNSLPASVFNAGSIPGGFLAAPPLQPTWRPGTKLSLRGPLGYGFSMPLSARRVALVALGDTIARLKPLIATALEQNAAVVFVSDLEVPNIPPEVEFQPLSELAEVVQWTDYVALDVPHENLSEIRERLGFGKQAKVLLDAQVLVVAPMPCGGMADCGVCAVTTRRGWKMACKDGPVFNLKELK